MGLGLVLTDLSIFGSLMHILGSVLIVYGQTIVKVAHCIVESSSAGVAGKHDSTWFLPGTTLVGRTPKW